MKHLKVSGICILFYIMIYYLWIIIWQENNLMLISGANIFQTIAPFISSVILFNSFKKTSSKDKRFWLYLIMAITCYGIAMCIWSYYEVILRIDPPFPGIPDLFWIGMNILFLIAIFNKFYHNNSLYKAFRSMVDIIIIMSVFISISWSFIINSIIQQSLNQSWSFVVVYVSYPISNLGMLFGALLLYLKLNDSHFKNISLSLFTGFMILFSVNSIYLYLVLMGKYETGSLFDPLWSLSILIIGQSGLFSDVDRKRNIKPIEENNLVNNVFMNVFFPYLSVLVLLILNQLYFDRILSIGLSISITFVILRQITIIFENKRLIVDFKKLNLELEDKIKERTFELEISNQKLESLFLQNSLAIYSLDLEGNFLSVNPACEKLTGYTNIEIIGKSIKDVAYNLQKTIYYFNKAIEGLTQNFETIYCNKDHKQLELEVSFIPIIVDDHVIGVYGILRDITEHKNNQKKIYHMAYHDLLTGLPNRRYLQNKIEEFVTNNHDENVIAAIMFIDLDAFKNINDTLGHDMGDKLLVSVSKKIKSCLGNNDVIARQGGDEFSLLLTESSSVYDIKNLAKKIIQEINKPMVIDNFELNISCSIGISIFPIDGVDSITLLKRADTAMYRVKEKGKNGFEFYSKLN